MASLRKLFKHTGRNDKIITELFLKDPNYDVRSDGSIWTCLSSNGLSITDIWRRAEILDCNGYFAINYKIAPAKREFAKRQRSRRLRAHRIMYAKFNGPLEADKVVNHYDGVKNNNEPSNLELITFEENTQHAFEVLGQSPIKNARLSYEIATEIRALKLAGKTHRELAERYDISKGHVSEIVNNLIWVDSTLPCRSTGTSTSLT